MPQGNQRREVGALEQRVEELELRLKHEQISAPAVSGRDELHRMLIELSNDAIIVHRGGPIVFANPAALAMHRATSTDQLIGRNRDDFIHPDDSAAIRKLRVEVKQQKGEFLPPAEVRGLRLDGSQFVYQGRACEIAWEGEPAVLLVMRDVTEYKRTEVALADKSALLQTTLDHMIQGISVYDADLELVAFNQRFVELFAFPPGFIRIGISYQQIAHSLAERGYYGPGDIEDQVAERLETARSGNARRFERTDHGGTTLEVLRNPLPGGGFVTTFTDTSERKRVEDDLRSSENRFRSLYNDTPAMMHSIDTDRRLVGVSDYWLKVMGYQRDEVIGREVVEFMTEDGRRYALDVILPKFMTTGELHEVEYQFVTKDGRIVDVLLSATAERNSEGKMTRSLAVLTEITERKRVENALRQTETWLMDAIESIPEGFVLFDADDRLVLCNERYKKLYSASTDSKIVPGARFEDIIRASAENGRHIAARGKIEEWIQERIAAHRNPTGPILQQLADGRWLRVEERKTREGGIVGIRTDITELKRREEDLAKAKETAELANRSMSEFLANMSHELRTPLNAVLGFSEMLRGEMYGPLGSERYREYAEDIHNSGKHLLEVINDILDLSKIEAGKLDLNEEVFDLGPAIESSVRVVKERAASAGIGLSVRVARQMPGIRADKRMVKQILINLLSNAVKFTGDGGKVTVSAHVEPGKGPVISVADNGIGIAEEDIKTALTPFGQVESVLNRKYSGTGLGLPLVKSLVELHGGRLDLISKVGEGTTVTIHFPPGRVVG